MYRAGKIPTDNIVAFRPEPKSAGWLAEVIELYPLADVVRLPVPAGPGQRALGWWGDLVPFRTDWTRDDHGGGSAA